MLKSEHRLFFTSWLRAPHRVAAVAPSSPQLAQAMAAQMPPGEGLVVELGGGTGAITKALLEQGLPPERLLVMERDGALCKFLVDKFPGIRIVRGDASRLKTVLGIDCCSTRIDAVISGLPLLAMEYDLQRTILAQSFECMDADGLFVQFTYSPFSPLPRPLISELGLDARKITRVWRNVPPAAVWCYTRTCADDEPLPKTA